MFLREADPAARRVLQPMPSRNVIDIGYCIDTWHVIVTAGNQPKLGVLHDFVELVVAPLVVAVLANVIDRLLDDRDD